mgnify:CR=1 FL=1
MDKYEYKIRSEEIKELIKEHEFEEAADIADTIDWRRVKSVSMLCMISDLYKLNKRYDDSRNILLMAYERHPGGRSIIYSLCELSLQLGEIGSATVYYQEFLKIAPEDSGRFVLLYKIYVANDVSVGEQIELLEDFERHDRKEKWMYELATLYHRNGRVQKCIEECDALFTWFGKGKYVRKALELKKQHAPLTPKQEEFLTGRRPTAAAAEAPAERQERTVAETMPAEDTVSAGEEQRREDYRETTQENPQGIYQSMPQEAYQGMSAEAMQEEYPGVPPEEAQGAYGEQLQASGFGEETAYADAFREAYPAQEAVAQTADEPTRVLPDASAIADEIRIKTLDANPYNTINLQTNIQEELAKNLQEVLGDSTPTDETKIIGRDVFEAVRDRERQARERRYDTVEAEPVPMRETVEDIPQASSYAEEAADEPQENAPAEETPQENTQEAEQAAESVKEGGEAEASEAETYAANAQAGTEAEIAAAAQATNEMKRRALENMRRSSGYDSLLSQEYDDQLRLVVPNENPIEKQITGQLNITDVLQEWERTQRESEKRYQEKVKQKILAQTGDLMARFEEEANRNVLEGYGLLRGDEAGGTKETSGAPKEAPAQEEPAWTEDEAYDGVEELAEEPAAPSLTADIDAEAVAAELTEAAEETENTPQEPLEELAEEPEEIAEEPAEEAEPADGVSEERRKDAEPSAEAMEDAEAAAAEAGEAADAQPEETQTLDETTEEAQGKEEAEAAPNEARAPQDKEKREGVRALTPEEKELFGSFVQSRKSREQMVAALDNISMASYTGNVILTGEIDKDNYAMAKSLMKYLGRADSNFSGKMAKITGKAFNGKDPMNVVKNLAAGELYITGASQLTEETVQKLYKALNREECAIVIVLEDRKKPMERFLEANPILKETFNARIDLEALGNTELARFAKLYAREMEYSIDEMGMLALLTRIENMQTSDHAVTVGEVRDIVDDAIDHANRIAPVHFMDIVLRKRYDAEDMIVLKERDFA